jgi:hypothetical protein
MTTQATIDGYVKSLKLSNLSQTIRDAIKVTRMLRLRYLWVDALCIIQDDSEDKRREIAYMGRIYKKSAVAIAAARAESTGQGFLDDWSADDEKPAVLPLMRQSKNLIESTKIVNTNYFDTIDWPQVWPLDTRAWALQEYLLSPRLLIFGAGGPVWQCQTQKLQPIIPSNKLFNTDLQRLPDAIFQTPTERQKSRSPRQRPTWHASERQKQHLTWKSIVENYSTRQISVPSDRLPAIAGVADELSCIWDDCYHFGMWRENLYQQLAWFAEMPQQEANAVPGVPSWSWLRVNTGVKHLDYIRRADLPNRPPLSESSRFYPSISCHVEDGHLVVDDGAAFMPANEMTEEERRQVFNTVQKGDSFHKLWLLEYLDGRGRYDFLGPLAVYMDFCKLVEHEIRDDTSEPESEVEYDALEPEIAKGDRTYWDDQVAYLTLGYVLGTRHDLGAYDLFSYRILAAAD